MLNLDYVTKKIVVKENIKYLLSYWNFKKFKVVFTNGCFDILHRGHIEYLTKAADFGEILIIGLNSDKSIKKIKGNGRPIMEEQSRALFLASFQFVNYVILFDEETPIDLINYIKPDILVKGGDYKKEDIVGNDIVTKNGGIVETIDFIEGYSTTSIIETIKKL